MKDITHPLGIISVIVSVLTGFAEFVNKNFQFTPLTLVDLFTIIVSSLSIVYLFLQIRKLLTKKNK